MSPEETELGHSLSDVNSAPVNRVVPIAAAPAFAPDGVAEVIDLEGTASGPAQILDALLKQSAGQWIECPIRPPMCPEARLVVTRDGQLMLVAVARSTGFQPVASAPLRHVSSDLSAIAQAYRWLTENRPLIRMALPQLTIDAHALPRLRLLVDHADVPADALQSMLAAGHVSVQTYRKVKWGEKLGLLLEAA